MDQRQLRNFGFAAAGLKGLWDYGTPPSNMKNAMASGIATAVASALGRSLSKTMASNIENTAGGDSGHQVHTNRRIIKKKKTNMDKAVMDAYVNTDLFAYSGKVFNDVGKQDISQLYVIGAYSWLNAYAPFSTIATRRFWVESSQHDIYITNTCSVPIELQVYWVGYKDDADQDLQSFARTGITEVYGTVNDYQNPSVPVQESRSLKKMTRCYYGKTVHMSPGQVEKFHFLRQIRRYCDTADLADTGNTYFAGFSEGILVRLHGTPVLSTDGITVSLSSASIAWTSNVKFRYRFPNGQVLEEQNSMIKSALSTTMVGEKTQFEDTGVLQNVTYQK